MCPQACPALASSLRGARLVYLLQHRVIYKILNKTRIFLTVTAAFLFTWKLPSPLPPSFGRGGGSGGRQRTDPGEGGRGLRTPGRPGRRRFANATKPTGRKSFSFDFNKMQLGKREGKLFPAVPMPPASGVGDARPKPGCTRGQRSGRRSPNPAGSRLPLREEPQQRRRLQVRPRPAPPKRVSRGGGKRPVLCERPPVPRNVPAWETGGCPGARRWIWPHEKFGKMRGTPWRRGGWGSALRRALLPSHKNTGAGNGRKRSGAPRLRRAAEDREGRGEQSPGPCLPGSC